MDSFTENQIAGGSEDIFVEAAKPISRRLP
jgi:hypothetical protein